MKKWNTFYILLAVVLAIVILKTSCMGDSKQDETTLKSKAVLENIAGRKSVRKYLNKNVEEDKIDAMVKAGMAAPSGMDRRPWEFVVVTERAALDSMAAKLPYAKMLTEAPVGYCCLWRYYTFFLLVFGLFCRNAKYSVGSRSLRTWGGMDGCLSLRGSD